MGLILARGIRMGIRLLFGIQAIRSMCRRAWQESHNPERSGV